MCAGRGVGGGGALIKYDEQHSFCLAEVISVPWIGAPTPAVADETLRWPKGSSVVRGTVTMPRYGGKPQVESGMSLKTCKSMC